MTKKAKNTKNAKTPGLNIPVVNQYFTCNKCRASEFHNECSLGFWCESYTPREPCPKPLTINQLINAPKNGA